LKVLFEYDENKNGENPHLRRTELVALVNTLGRVSHSLDAIQKFRHVVNTGEVGVLDIKGPLRIADNPPTDAKPAAEFQGVHEDSGANVASKGVYDEPDSDDLWEEPELQRQPTLADEFRSEFDLVWRTYKMVLRSWVELPFKIFAILVMEMQRLWNFWLGLPVPGRSWYLHFPGRDEL